MKLIHLSIQLLIVFSFTCALGISDENKSVAEKKSENNAKASETTKMDQEAQMAYLKGRQYMLSGEYSKAAPLLEKARESDSENSYLNHQLSEIYFRLANFERAEDLGSKAVEAEPTNIEYRANLAGIYASLKKYDLAKKQYLKIIEVEPGNTRAPLFLGVLEAESGDIDQGLDTLSDAIDKNKDNYMAFFYRAKIYLEKNEVEKAKKDLSTCLDLRPAFVEAGSALGLLHERLGEVDQALAAYNRIQGVGRFKKRMAQLYLQKNDFEKALSELLEYEKVEIDDYTARLKIALIFFELKRYEEAEARFTRIIKEEPEADVRFYLAAVYEEQKKLDLALKEFKKVSSSSSFFKESMLHVGFILRQQEKLSEGLKFTADLVKKYPSEPEFYDMRASFFEQKKQYKDALEVIEKGLAKFEDDEKLLYFAGALHDKLGDKEKGIKVMEQIIEKNEKNAHALNFLGYTYAELGKDLDKAEGYIKRAVELRPNDGFIEDSLGWVYFKQGRLDEALASLKKAAELQPNEPVIMEHLGDVYLAKNEFAKAKAVYEQAVAISKKKSDDEMAKKLKVKLASLEKENRVPTSGEKDKN